MYSCSNEAGHPSVAVVLGVSNSPLLFFFSAGMLRPVMLPRSWNSWRERHWRLRQGDSSSQVQLENSRVQQANKRTNCSTAVCRTFLSSSVVGLFRRSIELLNLSALHCVPWVSCVMCWTLWWARADGWCFQDRKSRSRAALSRRSVGSKSFVTAVWLGISFTFFHLILLLFAWHLLPLRSPDISCSQRLFFFPSLCLDSSCSRNLFLLTLLSSSFVDISFSWQAFLLACFSLRILKSKVQAAKNMN